MARESLTDFPGPLDRDILVIIPEDTYMGLALKERQFLESIPTDKKVALRVDSPQSLPNDRPIDSARLLRWIRDPSKAPEAMPDDRTVSVFNAVGEVNEVREVFRRCLAERISLDEVELLYTDRNAYVPIIYEIAARLSHEFASGEGLIATFDDGIPASYSRPGKALTAWTSWIMGGFLQSTFVKILEEDLLVLPGDPTDIQRLSMVRLLRSVKIGSGAERYAGPLERLATLYDRKLKAFEESPDDDNVNSDDRATLESKVHAAHCLKDVVRKILAPVVPQTIPSPVNAPSAAADAKKADQIDVLKSAKGFLELCARVDGDLDKAARDDLLIRIEDMESMVRQWGPLNFDMLKWLGNMVQEAQVMGSGPKPGAVYVAGIESGGHSGRKHTFIVGLDDGRFPAVGLQDPVILDTERQSLSRATSKKLPTAKKALTLQLQKFAYLLSRITGHVSLSYSCASIADDRETFPSPVLLSAYRIISQNRTADINDLVGSLRPAV